MFNLKKHYPTAILLLATLFTSSCTKSAGTGGQATIKGKVTVQNINVLGNVSAEYDAQDHDVYIIYGDNDNTFDDDVKTSHDGTFEFKYLNQGNYEIFTYSECLDCPNGQDSLIKLNSTISSKSEILELEDIIIANY
jgi:hypothetical protein